MKKKNADRYYVGEAPFMQPRTALRARMACCNYSLRISVRLRKKRVNLQGEERVNILPSGPGALPRSVAWDRTTLT